VLPLELEAAQRDFEAVLEFLLLGVEVAHRRPALERAHRRDRTRRVQHRFGQESLSCTGMADEGERMDVFERVLGHGSFLLERGISDYCP
jgi:hypothetical protein